MNSVKVRFYWGKTPFVLACTIWHSRDKTPTFSQDANEHLCNTNVTCVKRLLILSILLDDMSLNFKQSNFLLKSLLQIVSHRWFHLGTCFKWGNVPHGNTSRKKHVLTSQKVWETLSPFSVHGYSDFLAFVWKIFRDFSFSSFVYGIFNFTMHFIFLSTMLSVILLSCKTDLILFAIRKLGENNMRERVNFIWFDGISEDEHNLKFHFDDSTKGAESLAS